MRIVYFLIAFGISFSLLVEAYAGRPFSTEDAGIAEKGAFQLEISSEYAKQRKRDEEFVVSFVPIYGFNDRMEFSIEVPYTSLTQTEGDDEVGLGDVTLVLKTLLIEEKKSTPAFLLKTLIKLDNGDYNRGLGSGDEDIGFTLAATKTISKITLHGNLGYTIVGKEKEAFEDYILYGIAVEYPLNSKIKLVSEIYGEGNTHFDITAFKHQDIQGLIGLAYQLTDKVILDFAFIEDLNHNSTDFALTFGVSVTF